MKPIHLIHRVAASLVAAATLISLIAIPAQAATTSSATRDTGGVTLTASTDKTSTPVKVIDNLYETHYSGDYKLDDYLKANAGSLTDYLKWLKTNLNDGKDIPLTAVQACTTLAIQNPDGHRLLARNMDWYPSTPGMLVTTSPTNGYASVGVAGVMTSQKNGTPTQSDLETSANISPLLTYDGMNEKGLSAAILQIGRFSAPSDQSKPTISQMAVVRLLLDRTASVNEAITALQQVNVAAFGGNFGQYGGLHFALADASGDKATVEFDNGQMHVTRANTDWQVTENVMTYDGAINSATRWNKVNNYAKQAGGRMTADQALQTLAATPSTNLSALQWTVVYDLTDHTGLITTHGNTKLTKSLTMDGITSDGTSTGKTITLKYDANGGTGSLPDTTGNPGDTITIPNSGVTRNGYTLTGWNTSKDGKGTSVPTGTYTIPANAPAGTVTLYAQWQKTDDTSAGSIDVYIGDSITSGQGVDATQRWSRLLSDASKTSEHDYAVAGSGYDATKTDPKGENTFSKQLDKAAQAENAKNVGRVFITGMTNDLEAHANDLNGYADTYAKLVADTIGKAKQLFPDAQIIVIPAMPVPSDKLEAGKTVIDTAINVLVKAARQADPDAKVMDADTAWSLLAGTTDTWQSDQVHPNQAGHAKLAQAVKAWLDGGSTGTDTGDLPDRLVNGSFEYPSDWPAECMSNMALHVFTASGAMDCAIKLNGSNIDKPTFGQYTLAGFDQSKFGWHSGQTKDSADGRGTVELRFDTRNKDDALKSGVSKERRADQYSEIVAEQAGGYLYQDVKTIPGHTYHWNLAHASYRNSKNSDGRTWLNDPDCMSVVIGPAPTDGGTFQGTAQQAVRLADGAGNDKAGDVGTRICSTVDETGINLGDLDQDPNTGQATVHSKENEWERYGDKTGYVATSTVTRFTFASIKQYSEIHGNLINDITFSEDTTVTYHANITGNQSGSWTDKTLAGDYTIVSNEHNRFTRTGYKLIGWSRDPDASKPDLQTGDVIDVPSEGADLYAVWEKTGPTPSSSLPETGARVGLVVGGLTVVSLLGAIIARRRRLHVEP